MNQQDAAILKYNWMILKHGNKSSVQWRYLNMAITEILQEIHKERVELKVYQALQQWLFDDRKEWINRAMGE